LASALDALKQSGVAAKYLYTIPTVQNPTGSVLPLERRQKLLELARSHKLPVFEDDCYADLVFSGARPPALFALARQGGWDGVIHIGSFSKSVAPALRVGFLVANWDVMSRILALKSDAGSGALEQMVLAEFCDTHFDTHVAALTKAVKRKAGVMVEALAEHFGTAAEFEPPVGGIFLWLRLPEAVDTSRLAVVAAAEGIALNAGPDWSVAGPRARRWLRLCFANPSEDVIRDGVAALAAVCQKEFGVPVRIGNVRQSTDTTL
jgi:2-aminoadipate transaminase